MNITPFTCALAPLVVASATQARVTEIGLLRHLDEALAGRFLVADRDRVLEITEHYVDLARDILDFRADLLVVRRNEVDHALDTDGKGPEGFGRADGERGEMFRRRTDGAHRRRDLDRMESGCGRDIAPHSKALPEKWKPVFR